jgi:putative ABC transport system permease protein
MLLDNIRLSVRNLRHRPKRSWLTIVGILIGVAAVVALVSLGQGMQRSITQEFEAFGYNVVMIAGHGEHRLGMGALLGAHTFQLDLAPIKNIPGVEAVGGVLVKTPYISAGRREGYLLTWGIAPELMQSFSNYYKPALGRSLKPGERQTAVLGSTIAQDLGLAVGDTFVIETLEFEVVGILERRADPDVNYAIMIPIATLQELFGEGDKLSLVLIRTAQHGHAGHDVNSIAKEVRRIVREQRGKDDLNVHTTGEMLDLMQNLVGIIQAALGGIAAISLLVGGVGVMNTMYTAVLERTREIGVMKAVGARRRHILMLFLLESGFMGLIGGVLGAFVGLGIALGIKLLAPIFLPGTALEVGFSPGLMLSVLVFSFVLGALSGFFPAREAAKLPPVEALRYE